MKAGDRVVYCEGERKFDALVLASHTVPDHLGEDDEPLVHLVIVDDNPPRAGLDKSAPVALKPEQKIRVVHDVVHISHEYSDQYKQKQGLPQGDDELSKQRAAAAAGPGRYARPEELEPADPEPAPGSQAPAQS